MKSNELIPTESQEQQAIFDWATYQILAGKYPELNLMYHIPNEGKRSYVTGKRLRAEGLKTGVPDICLPVARGQYHGLYIELKRTKGSTTTANQAKWIEALAEQGYYAIICYGFNEAIKEISAYLKLKEL